jgi:hypothetical protein
MQRPTGVTIIAVLDFIGAGFCVIGGLLMFMGGSIVASIFSAAAANGAAGAAPAAGIMGSIGVIAGVIALLLAAFAVAVALGLLKLKNWARVTTIVFSVLGLLGNLNGFRAGMSSALVGPVIGLALNIWIIWYMLQPHVKAAFGQTSAA